MAAGRGAPCYTGTGRTEEHVPSTLPTLPYYKRPREEVRRISLRSRAAGNLKDTAQEEGLPTSETRPQTVPLRLPRRPHPVPDVASPEAPCAALQPRPALPITLSPVLGPRVPAGPLGGMWSCLRLPMASAPQTGPDSPRQQLRAIPQQPGSCQATKANRTPPTLTCTVATPPHTHPQVGKSRSGFPG